MASFILRASYSKLVNNRFGLRNEVLAVFVVLDTLNLRYIADGFDVIS